MFGAEHYPCCVEGIRSGRCQTCQNGHEKSQRLRIPTIIIIIVQKYCCRIVIWEKEIYFFVNLIIVHVQILPAFSPLC